MVAQPLSVRRIDVSDDMKIYCSRRISNGRNSACLIRSPALPFHRRPEYTLQW